MLYASEAIETGHDVASKSIPENKRQLLRDEVASRLVGLALRAVTAKWKNLPDVGAARSRRGTIPFDDRFKRDG